MKKSWIVLAASTLAATSGCTPAGPMDASGKPKPASVQIETTCADLVHVVNATEDIRANSFEAAGELFDITLEQTREFAAENHLARLGLVEVDANFNASADTVHPNKPANKFYKMRVIYHLASEQDARMLGKYLVTKKFNVNVNSKNPCNDEETPGSDE